MHFDFTLFDSINGLAGHFSWLDTAGRLLAVFGLLVAFLTALVPAWQPRPARGRYLRALAGALLACAVLALLEWLAVKYLLHHEVRSRPMNARWVTLLVMPETAMAFPAWPVVLVFAVALPVLRVWRALGSGLLVLGALIAVALVFVGINFPFDVISGAVLGLAVGWTAAVVTGLHSTRRGLLPVLAAAGLWFMLMALIVRPASSADIAMVPAGTGALHVAVPPAVVATLNASPDRHTVTLQAADNGHLTVATARVLLAEGAVPTLPALVALTRDTANTLFRRWPRLDLLTVTVAGRFRRGDGEKVGTLYTATLDRAAMPAGGFPASQPLPGNKFVNPLLLRDGR